MTDKPDDDAPKHTAPAPRSTPRKRGIVLPGVHVPNVNIKELTAEERRAMEVLTAAMNGVLGGIEHLDWAQQGQVLTHAMAEVILDNVPIGGRGLAFSTFVGQLERMLQQGDARS